MGALLSAGNETFTHGSHAGIAQAANFRSVLAGTHALSSCKTRAEQESWPPDIEKTLQSGTPSRPPQDPPRSGVGASDGRAVLRVTSRVRHRSIPGAKLCLLTEHFLYLTDC